MNTATLTNKGRLILPKDVRDRLGLKPGDEFTCYAVGYDEIVIRRKRLDVSDLVGILRVPDKRASVEAITESYQRVYELTFVIQGQAQSDRSRPDPAARAFDGRKRVRSFTRWYKKPPHLSLPDLIRQSRHRLTQAPLWITGSSPVMTNEV